MNGFWIALAMLIIAFTGSPDLVNTLIWQFGPPVCHMTPR